MILAGILLVFLFNVEPALQSATQWSFADPTSTTSFASTIGEIRASPYPGNLSTSIAPCSSNEAIYMSGHVEDAATDGESPSIVSGVTPECDTTTTIFDSTTTSETKTVTMLVDCYQTYCSTTTDFQTFFNFIPSIWTTTMTVEAPMPSFTCTPYTTVHWFTYTYTTYTTIEFNAPTMIIPIWSSGDTTTSYRTTDLTEVPGATITVHSQVSYFMTTWFEDIRTLYTMPGVIEPSRRPDFTFTQPIASAIQTPLITTRISDPDTDSPKTQTPIPPAPSQPMPTPPAMDDPSLSHSATPQADPPNRMSTSVFGHKSHPTAVIAPISTFQFQPSKPSLAIHPAPSGPGILLPNGQTLEPGHATQQGSLHISLPTNTHLSYVIVNGHSIAKTQLPTLSDAVLPALGSPLPTRDLSSPIKSLEPPYIITLPNGQTLTPGTPKKYNNHTFFLSPSNSTLSIDGEVVEKYYAVNTEPGSKYSTVLWTVEIPGEDGGYLLLAPKEWREGHHADVTVDGKGTIVVVDGRKSVALDMATFQTALPGDWGVDADAKGVVGTEGTGGTVSLTEVTVTVENSDGLVTTPMMGTPSGKGEVGERNGEKGTASWSVAKTVRGSGLAMGVVILHALYANT